MYIVYLSKDGYDKAYRDAYRDYAADETAESDQESSDQSEDKPKDDKQKYSVNCISTRYYNTDSDSEDERPIASEAQMRIANEKFNRANEKF